ncbi:hypothetical protein [Neobacillus kokaensis]|uniref:Uncharacterized protein n=1 Tax=Neobacillus kokaensis TaxID=2759023 RepID=A0ABQ3N3V1_9BACI|nr:hypothetical protein [Neobacillus kokaensis]GHH98317.1 hypothetical protein AM1BK_18600 [Neobacillus kokaensis]
MSNLQSKLELWINDVNQEDGITLSLFAKITDTMFSLIKWAGIPFVLYLLFEIARW